MLKDENGKELGEFRVGDVLEVENLKFTHPSKLVEGGNLPYVTRTASNNGLTKMVEDSSEFTHTQGGVITLGAETVEFFYQPYDKFIVGNKMYSIKGDNMSQEIAMYIITAAEKATKGFFSYNNGLTGTKFKEVKIFLPVTPENTPDWEYMESYISTIEHKYLNTVKAFNDKEMHLLQELYGVDGDLHLQEPEYGYGDFEVGNLFKALTKTRKIKDFEKSRVQTSVCNTPSTSATTQNNMIGYYVSDEQHNLNPPGITVTANGDGFAAWQPMSTAISQDSYYLVPLHEEMTESVQKYILVHLVVLLKKYNFNSKSGWAKVKNDVVSLPIDDNGDLDWEYMEKYISIIAQRERESRQIYHYKTEQILKHLISAH